MISANNVRTSLLPYILAVLLLAAGIVLDLLYNQIAMYAAKTFNINLRWAGLIGLKIIFGLLAVAFVWAVYRSGMTPLGGAVLFVVGTSILLAPLVIYYGHLKPNLLVPYLRGEFLLSSAAILLAGGLFALIARAAKKPEGASTV